MRRSCLLLDRRITQAASTPYCSLVTFCIQSTTLPSSASAIATCDIAHSGAAPCQYFSPGQTIRCRPDGFPLRARPRAEHGLRPKDYNGAMLRDSSTIFSCAISTMAPTKRTAAGSDQEYISRARTAKRLPVRNHAIPLREQRARQRAVDGLGHGGQIIWIDGAHPALLRSALGGVFELIPNIFANRALHRGGCSECPNPKLRRARPAVFHRRALRRSWRHRRLPSAAMTRSDGHKLRSENRQ